MKNSRRPLLGLLLLSLCLPVGAAQAADGKPARPHIIFILTGDLGPGDLGCYGGRQAPTPRIDQLAKEGTRFTQYYAPRRVAGQHVSRALRGTSKTPLPAISHLHLPIKPPHFSSPSEEDEEWTEPKPAPIPAAWGCSADGCGRGPARCAALPYR